MYNGHTYVLAEYYKNVTILTQTVIMYLILLGIKTFALVWQEIVREFRR